MKVGFIVEGHLEADAISHICKGSEVRRLRLNGRDVSIERLSHGIYTHASLLLRKTSRVHVIVDREQRAISSQEMSSQLRTALQTKGIDCSRISFGIPDRNIESWLVPFVDDQGIFQKFPLRGNDGLNGKALMKDIFRKNGRSYVEVIDGVKMMKLLIPSELCNISDSFKSFWDTIDDDCWWKSKQPRHT